MVFPEKVAGARGDTRPALLARLGSAEGWISVGRLALTTAEVLLVLLVIRAFRLASPGVADVLKLAGIGFVAHALLPLRFRLPFFVALSAAAVLHVLGLASGAALIGIGLVLIAACHLPVAFGLRVGLLLALGAILTAARAGAIPLPLSSAVWPILGSMFMFRLIVYLYDLRHDPKLATPSATLAYFFLLPNVAFPFFPVVDFKTFRRTYFDTEPWRIYSTGVRWMLRGVVHLILYRFVYYYLTISPEEVLTSGQLARFVISNYALYLRVSGIFHLVVGLLHLFGFNLPATNHLYFLASSFTDYWRRINIYWKDFMMKVFYYPAYFWLRRLGPTAALVLATVVVFLATTVLHSYQWFWLRGDWYLSQQDMLFWSALAALVVVNVVYEAKRGRKRSLGSHMWTLREVAGRAARILLTFALLSSLWSLWTSPSPAEWAAMWSLWNVGPLVPRGVALGILGGLIVASLITWALTATHEGRHVAQGLAAAWNRAQGSPAGTLAPLVALLVIADPRVQQRFDSTFMLVVEDLQHERLNRGDQATLERGYYENLLGVERSNAELATVYSKVPTDWRDLWETDAVRSLDNLLRLELVPSFSMSYKGAPFTTNAWGMRDLERSRTPAAGTFRFAVLGASTTMGSGVPDQGTYAQLVEERFRSEAGVRVELLNFAVESYNAIEQVGVVDWKVPGFGVHSLLYIAHETEFEKTVDDLARLVENRTPLVYSELMDVVTAAGVHPGMKRTIALRALNRSRDAIIAFAYHRIVASARERGELPVWVFLPMPVPGTGPCPPGRSQLFCFGSTSRVGAAADRTDPRVQRLFQLAEGAGFVTIDLSGIYGDVEVKSLWITPWDGHPNAAGHRLIADGLWTALNGTPDVQDAIRRVTARSEP